MITNNKIHLTLFILYSLVLLNLIACYPGQQSTKQTDNAFKYYSRAIEQFQAKNYTDALNYINDAIGTNKRIAVYYELKGDIFYAQDSLNNALSAYSDAKNRRSFYPEIYIKTGEIYYKKNDYNSAIRDFRKAIAQRPEQPDLMLSLIQCYLQQFEYDVALNLLQEYNTQVNKQKKPLHSDYYILLAKIQFEKAKYEEVIFSVDITRKIKKLSRNSCLFYLRSLVYVNKLEEAYALATKEYKDVLLESDIHFIRGLYYYSQNNFKDAETQLEQSIQKKTKIHEAYLLLADIFSQKGDDLLASEYLQNGQEYKSYRLINIDHKY